jgi:hypothetical protein
MKKALIILGVLLAIVAGGAFLAYHSLDVILKVALEYYAPDIAGVSVKVGDIRISPRDGRGSVKGVEIGNPPGFSAPRAVRLGEISVAIDPGTATEPIVLIHDITIDAPLITYERGNKGANLEVIQKNIESYVKRAGAPSDGKTPSGKAIRHRFIVERLAIRGAKVTMTNPGLKGQGVTFDLPDIELRDLGKRENGLTASEVANIVASTLVSRIAQKLLTNLELLRKGGVGGAIDALKGLVR